MCIRPNLSKWCVYILTQAHPQWLCAALSYLGLLISTVCLLWDHLAFNGYFYIKSACSIPGHDISFSVYSSPTTHAQNRREKQKIEKQLKDRSKVEAWLACNGVWCMYIRVCERGGSEHLQGCHPVVHAHIYMLVHESEGCFPCVDWLGPATYVWIVWKLWLQFLVGCPVSYKLELWACMHADT